MKKISIYFALSLMVVTFVAGLVFGYFITPSYRQTMYGAEEMSLGQADRFVDLRYINRMASHHRAAILLAKQAHGKSSRTEINSLTLDIQKNEPVLINELYQWKKDWYKDGRREEDPIVANLGQVDETLDLRFLNALIAHHEAGIDMTKEIRMKSTRSEILNNADTVENFLATSLVMLKDWRRQWYGVN